MREVWMVELAWYGYSGCRGRGMKVQLIECRLDLKGRSFKGQREDVDS